MASALRSTVPSIGTVGDIFDNAWTETVNGYYKAEPIRGPAREGRLWKTIEDVELATLSWVHWHNHDVCHGYLDDSPSLHQTQGDSSWPATAGQVLDVDEDQPVSGTNRAEPTRSIPISSPPVTVTARRPTGRDADPIERAWTDHAARVAPRHAGTRIRRAAATAAGVVRDVG